MPTAKPGLKLFLSFFPVLFAIETPPSFIAVLLATNTTPDI
jgi:hypothetical protein